MPGAVSRSSTRRVSLSSRRVSSSSLNQKGSSAMVLKSEARSSPGNIKPLASRCRATCAGRIRFSVLR